MEKLKLKFISPEQKGSKFDWVDIYSEEIRVGQARCLKQKDCLIIYSIFIYPEYQGNGYGRKFVETARSKFPKIIADRVRYKAIGFWKSLGFVPNQESDFWHYPDEFSYQDKSIG